MHSLILILNLLLSNAYADIQPCQQPQMPNKCSLVSLEVTDNDFEFPFPDNLDPSSSFFEIFGSEINLKCSKGCQKISFATKKFPVHFSLKNAKIFSQAIEIQFQGKLIMEESALDVSGLSQRFYDDDSLCLSTSGYCYYGDNNVLKSEASPLLAMSAFYAFLKSRALPDLSQFLGFGKSGQLPGGGRLIADVDEFRFGSKSSLRANAVITEDANFKENNQISSSDFSVISSNFLNLHQNKSKEKSLEDKRCQFKDDEQVVSGVGGYIFIRASAVFIAKTAGHLEAVGSCLSSKNQKTYSSSSSGSIFFYFESLTLSIQGQNENIKRKFPDRNSFGSNEPESLLPFLKADNDCLTSSVGIALVSSISKSILAFSFEKKSLSTPSMRNTGDDQSYTNKFSLDFTSCPRGPFKFYFSKLRIAIDLSIPAPDIFGEIWADSAHFGFNFQNSDSILQISSLSVQDSFFELSANLLAITQNFASTRSMIIVQKLWVGSAEFVFSGSTIAPFEDLQNEVGVDRPDYTVFFSLKQILDNFAEYKDDFFVSLQNSQKVSVKDFSGISSPVVVIVSPSIEIQSGSKIFASFVKKVVQIPNNQFCGVEGAFNEGMGFLALDTKNDLCLFNYLETYRPRLFKWPNPRLSITKDIYYYKISPLYNSEVFQMTGGVVLLQAQNFVLGGTISVEGEKSLVNERLSVAATAGGSVLLCSKQIALSPEGMVKLGGGSGIGKNGPGGGGKVVLDFDPRFQQQMKMENFDLGLSALPSTFDRLYPSRALSFYERFKDLLQAKIISLAECPPGFTGPFCDKCRVNSFKPFYGTGKCVECPCEVLNPDDLPVTPQTSVRQCLCIEQSIIQRYFLEISLVLGILLSVGLYNMHESTVVKEKEDLFLNLKIEEIPNVMHRVYVEGLNQPFSPLKIRPQNFDFLAEPMLFCQRFNNLAVYHFLEKVFLGFLYVFNYSPIFQLAIHNFMLRKIKRLKKMLREFEFRFKEKPLQVKCVISSNYSSVQLAFVDSTQVLGVQNFLAKFPICFQLCGSGDFTQEFKINFSDPFAVLFVKEIKRSIGSSLSLNYLVPEPLSKESGQFAAQSSCPSIDCSLAYLNLLFATILANIPRHKLKERLTLVDKFIDSLNRQIVAFGFKLKFFVYFGKHKQFLKIGMTHIVKSDAALFKQFAKLLKNQSEFDIRFFLTVKRVERKEPISIFFESVKTKIKNPSPIKNFAANEISKARRKSRPLKNIEQKFIKDAYFKTALYLAKKLISAVRIRLWKQLTYHNCQVFAANTKYLLIALYLVLLVIRKLINGSEISDSVYWTIRWLVFPGIEDLNIIVWVLQVGLAKKKLLRLSLLCNFMCFLKAALLGIALFVHSFESEKQVAYIYLIYSFTCFTICYMGSFIVSYGHFLKYLKRIAHIN